MRIKIIAVGEKMPDWVDSGYQQYATRLRGHWSLQLVEIPALKRGKNADFVRLLAQEEAKVSAALDKNAHVIALDRLGKSLSSKALADAMLGWQDLGQDINILIGGPEGFSKEFLKRCSATWSLSSCTFPHPLVRVMLAEQLYRGVAIIQGSPYHR